MKVPILITYEKKPPTLEEAQSLIGGYVELVPLPDGQILCDEDGLMKGLQLNPLATRKAGQPIVGDAIFLTGKGRWR